MIQKFNRIGTGLLKKICKIGVHICWMGWGFYLRLLQISIAMSSHPNVKTALNVGECWFAQFVIFDQVTNFLASLIAWDQT